ncbi:sensor histidine kinase [Actinomyces wuliandei]|uniref:sensor histidine kinase n=1 Tax=Actinomyces wuliandei TaxID=2057743 RepID=UPI001119A4CE|nr:histidine kinase [Actinomyces wuliandei]
MTWLAGPGGQGAQDGHASGVHRAGRVGPGGQAGRVGLAGPGGQGTAAAPTRRDRPRALPHDWWRRDLAVALLALVLCGVETEAVRSLGVLERGGTVVAAYGFAGGLALLCVWRRRFPLSVAACVFLLFLVVNLTEPDVLNLLGNKAVLALVLFSTAAWAWPRRRARTVLAALVAGLLLLGAVLTVRGTVASGLWSQPTLHLLPPGLALLLDNLLVNAMWCGLPVLAGTIAWHLVQERMLVEEQAALIDAQAEERRADAVADERLWIARDLHEVASRDVAAVGVSAAALRRNLTSPPPEVAQGLQDMEAMSREAVRALRLVVGSLRQDDGGGLPPGLDSLPGLVEELGRRGLRVRYSQVECCSGMTGRVPAAVGLSLYRVAQGSLSSVLASSTADEASLVLRVLHEGAGHAAEVEVVDRGRRRETASGDRRGLLGVSERLAAHGGTAEIGPRLAGGYGVRVRLPFRPVEELG